MKTTTYLTICLLITSLGMSAQVGIGNTDPKSSLDIRATNESTPANTDGVLIPRVSAFPATDPTNEQDGMFVYLNQDIPGFFEGFHYWDADPAPGKWLPFVTEEWKNGVNSSGDDLIFATQAKNAGTDVVITDDGRVGFGTENPVERFEFKGPGDNDFQITSANSNPPNLIFYNTGGTLAAPAAFTNADQEIGSVIAKTHDGANIREPGGFRFFLEGVPSPGNTPSRFVISTTPAGSTAQQNRLIIRGSGNTGLSVADPTATLHLRAGTATATSAPLKLNAGTNLTTPETGAIEYDGSELYFTPATSRQLLIRGYKATATLNFPFINRGRTSDINVTVTGATVGSNCNCSPVSTIEQDLTWNCFVSATDTVTIRLNNARNGGGSFNPASRDWSITVFE